MTENLPHILIVLGPTACGKSELAVELALRFNAEIISADSMQVYRGMDIGSAKMPPARRRGVPHHLLDVADPDVSFSVADWHDLAEERIADILSRGRLPLLCGGTGLYINSLVYPYNFSGEGNSDPAIRARLQEEFSRLGGEALHRRLEKSDPPAAARIHPHDSRRLIRALEVLESSGRPISSLRQENEPVKYAPTMIGLTARRELLYQRIDSRVEQMLDMGLVQEVRGLLMAGLSRDAVSMQGLGYKQMAAALAGELELAEAVELIKRDTRRFAKRQLTWFKRDQRIRWFDIDQYLEEGELVNAVSSRVGENPEEV